MRAHMHFQIGIGGERSGADLAHVRLDAVMRAQMSYQRRRLRETLAADLTEESLGTIGFLVLLEGTIVLGQMIVELLLLDEALGASGALVWLYHVVLSHMDLEVFPPIKFLRTYVAQIFLAFVHLNVPQKALSGCILFAALGTLEPHDIGSPLPTDFLARFLLFGFRFNVPQIFFG